MKNKFAERFPKITHAVLEHDGEGPHVDPASWHESYDSGNPSSFVSESPRLVATYRLVRVQLLVKRSRVEVIKQRRRKRK